MRLSVCKVKSWRCLLGRKSSNCAFVKSMFIGVANIVSSGQNAFAPVTLNIMYRCSFAKSICYFRCTSKRKYHGTKYEMLGL